MLLLEYLVACALLWSCCCLGAPPRAPREVRGRCSSSAECGGAAETCRLQTCVCADPDAVLSATRGCLQVRGPGETCVEDAQCRRSNASCEEQSCVCDSGFYHDANASTCVWDKSGGEEARGAAVDQNMIIVLAVLAIMFVGICVALHLFSKARFRNRRTIFNSPHPRLMHIKLGKRKKSSIRHLPPPPPFLGGRHHSFSGHHSPVAPPIPKTRSHECLRSSLSREASPKFERRPRTAPLAEKESLPPSCEELDAAKDPARVLREEEVREAPGSPTVIITDADGAHTVVTQAAPSAAAAHV